MRPVHERFLLAIALLGLSASTAPGAAGTLIVLNKSDATASLIDLKAGKVVATLPTGRQPHEAAVSPDGKQVIATNYGTRELAGSTLTVIDVPQRRVVKTIEVGAGRRPHGVLFLDKRRALVTAEGSQALLIVDAMKGVVAAEIPTAQAVSHMVAASSDGKRAFVTNIGSGTVTAIDLAARKVLAHVATGEGAEGVAVTPNGKEVWVTNRAADTVSVLDATSLRVVATLPSAAFPIRVAMTPDGRRALVSNARSGDVAVFDVAARKEIARMRAPLEARSSEGRLLSFAGSTPIGVLIHQDGKKAYVAHANADAIAVFDLAKLEFAGTLPAGREPDGMALSPLPRD
ncbi:MAG TPA: cytochrome D1 domain-containing protein [Myxococcaceae bacterium]|nr:cytochrome D1 domain-containing protein [Myxococcaceae bacterium]